MILFIFIRFLYEGQLKDKKLERNQGMNEFLKLIVCIYLSIYHIDK
jgi:hypothetical protein